MTHDEFETKVLRVFDNQVRKIVQQRVSSITRSGAIDLSPEETDTDKNGLTKIVLAAALRDTADCFPALSKEHKAIAKNLTSF